MSRQELSFDSIYHEQADYVFGLAFRLSKTRSDAEDLFQESFMKAYRFFPKFRGGSIRSWLRTIVVNTNVSRHRGLKNQHVTALDSSAGWREALVDHRPGPPDIIEKAEEKSSLEEALLRLTDDARAVLILREFEGLDYQEIAAVLEVPKGTVRSRLARARESLRAELESSLG